MLPADFTAEAVTTLGLHGTHGHRSYNVVNPHDDGISLDEFVDWLIEAGHPIQRIDDYDDWSSRFHTALQALPDAYKQHSLLPLLHAYRRPGTPVRGSALPTDNFRKAVRAADIGPTGDIPHLSAQLINKYVSDLRERKLFEE